MLRRLLILIALLIAPAMAQARGIEPELVAESSASPGGEVELAIHMKTRPGWHGYWLNPGDAGLPMAVKWELPAGYSVGPLRYPVPTRLTVAGIMNYVFERDYAVLVRLKVPKDANGTVPIRASATWLACTDKICVPEKGTMALDLPVGVVAPERREQFDEWRRALPRPLVTPAKFEISGNKLHRRGPAAEGCRGRKAVPVSRCRWPGRLCRKAEFPQKGRLPDRRASAPHRRARRFRRSACLRRRQGAGVPRAFAETSRRAAGRSATRVRRRSCGR